MTNVDKIFKSISQAKKPIARTRNTSNFSKTNLMKADTVVLVNEIGYELYELRNEANDISERLDQISADFTAKISELMGYENIIAEIEDIVVNDLGMEVSMELQQSLDFIDDIGKSGAENQLQRAAEILQEFRQNLLGLG